MTTAICGNCGVGTNNLRPYDIPITGFEGEVIYVSSWMLCAWCYGRVNKEE